MTGDVFYQEVKPARSPRGSIVPPGCHVETVDGRQELRIPADVTHVETPIVFPGFTVVIEGDELNIDGPTIVDAALAAEGLEAPNTTLTTPKEVEVIGLLRVKSVRARIVRGARIESDAIDAGVSTRAEEAIVARNVTVRDGAIRAPQLVASSVSGENTAESHVAWDDALAQGLVPEWLRDS